ncbi:MAG: efflux RND transporter periplasmic adaptor subunit [Candidatus Gracilibacteria bacterium]|nr:efflux RND transporter periplasmic adaptor subunit [Candidatus Gracilibacteria bacterium]
MKKIFLSLFLVTLLVSCSGDSMEDVGNNTSEKQDFFIETKKLSDFLGSFQIKKSGKINPTQDITISSNANGRVGNIFVKEGDRVYVGSNLISMQDTVANYALNLDKARLSVESVEINYEQTKINLDKAVADTKLNLEKLQKDYEILQKTIEENIASAKINLDNSITNSNSSLFGTNSGASKAELDYNNLIKSNQEQIRSFETSVHKDYLNLKNLFSDIINFSDRLLGVTELNKNQNDSFENYLGAKNTALKNELENELLKLISFKKEKFDSIESNGFDIDKLDYILGVGEEGYKLTILFLDKLEDLFDYSVESTELTSSDISTYKITVNTYQTTLQGNYSAFLTFKASVDSFLSTYKNTEDALKKQLDINEENAQITYNKVLLDSQNQLNSMESAIKNAQINYDNSIKTRDITLQNLENQISIAKNTRSLAQNEYSKLSITSPIVGVVSDIMVDKGQEVNIGMPLIKISSLGDSEINIAVGYNQLDYFKVGKKVIVKYLGNNLEGIISSVSPNADNNLNYKVQILVKSDVKLAGNIVDVYLDVELGKTLLPLGIIKIKSDGLAQINTLSGTILSTQNIYFGEFYGDKIEIKGCVGLSAEDCNNLDIVINDMSNFDEEKFKLIIK